MLALPARVALVVSRSACEALPAIAVVFVPICVTNADVIPELTAAS